MSTQPFLDLITSEHADKPKYTAMVEATVLPSAELIDLLKSIPNLFDVDVAVGQQLDVVGQWVGVGRGLETPISGVYFELDGALVGFDSGVWIGPYDPITGITQLSDFYYRILIKIRILNNHWNGSLDDAYALTNQIFSSLGYTFFIEDRADLSISFGLIGSGPPDVLTQALLVSGKFNVKPAGIRVKNYLYQTVAGPLFAFDLNTSLFAGFDTGGWAHVV